VKTLRPWLAVLLAFQLAHADPAAEAQRALKGLTNPSLEKRLEANSQLENLDPKRLPANLISHCIASLSQAVLREKDRFRPGDYARCLMGYAARSSNPQKDLISILPLLTHSSSEVVQYAWAGVGEWATRPLKQPVVDKLLVLLDHPRDQVRINALVWLCRHAQIDTALEADRPLTALQESTWQRLLKAAQQGQSLRLRTTAVRFLLSYAPLDPPKVMTLLGEWLTQPEIDEEDVVTYQQLDRWIDKRGLQAAALAEPLARAAELFQKRKLAHLQLRWRAMVAPWSPQERALVRQLVQEAPFDESNLQVASSLAVGLAEHGPDGRADMLVLASRLGKQPWFRQNPVFVDSLARVGVDSAAAGDCLKLFALDPDPIYSGLLTAVGASGSKDPLLHKDLLAYLSHQDKSIQSAAAYSLACLDPANESLRKWLAQAVQTSPCEGLLLGALRHSQYKPVLPPGFQVTTGPDLILKHMAGQPDASWGDFVQYLQEDRYPLRCWRSSTLADKEATLASLELLLADPPKFAKEPLALKLLMGSADPELAGAASRCYQTLWATKTSTRVEPAYLCGP